MSSLPSKEHGRPPPLPPLSFGLSGFLAILPVALLRALAQAGQVALWANDGTPLHPLVI
jgi:hypothetical protein